MGTYIILAKASLYSQNKLNSLLHGFQKKLEDVEIAWLNSLFIHSEKIVVLGTNLKIFNITPLIKNCTFSVLCNYISRVLRRQWVLIEHVAFQPTERCYTDIYSSAGE